MASPSVQDGIDRAGSAVDLLWKPNAEPWYPEAIEAEYAGWKVEQNAWHDSVTIADLSHHMSDTFIEGPDATRLLSEVSANNYENFTVDRAKQFVPVAEDGNIITDGILLRTGEHSYVLSGVPAAQNWVIYHAEQGGHDVRLSTNRETSARAAGLAPALFRYQLQGPSALELVNRVFGGPLPETKFFHSTPVSLGDRPFRALRHGMAGQPGYEFIGEWKHGAAVKEALIRAGEPLGLVHQGARSYPTASMDSGWIASPVPAIYTAPELAGYRRWVPLYSYEGMKPLQGSFFSRDIEDYYASPYELGYGKSISFNHDFIGRDALLKAQHGVPRTKVTLVFDRDDTRRALGEHGPDHGYVHHYWRNRVEAGGALVGLTFQTDYLDPVGAVMALALVDTRSAAAGTEVDVVWGQHPGGDTDPGADLGHPRLRATVHPAPYDRTARTTYRKS